MALKRSIIELVGLQVVKIIAGTVYIAGLTALIPLLPLVFSPQELVKAEYALAAAFGFIFAGFLLVYWFSGSHRVALRALGLYTLIPGTLAVLFLFSPHHIAKLFRLFGDLPNLEQYLQSYLPNAWFLAGVYIIVGSFLVWLSVKK
jgi:drug/metabolite transporter superfamily protein YnfA